MTQSDTGPAPSKRQLNLRLPEELLAFVDRQAATHFQTRNEYLTALVVAAFRDTLTE